MFCLMLGAGALLAQQKIAAPEYNNVPMYLDQDGSLKSLERQTGELHAKIRALGYGGANASYTYNGEHSPEQFNADHLQFVIRLKNDGDDPASAISLFTVQAKKGKRSVVNTKVRFLIGAKSSMSESRVPIRIEKCGENLFRITPEQKLPPGEYVFNTAVPVSAITGQSVTGFLFGIR
jgi:hypothetical protein